MKDIFEILKGFDITVPEDRHKDLRRALSENYVAINEHNLKIDNITTQLSTANDTITGLKSQLDDAKKVDVKALQDKIKEYEDAEADRIQKEKIAKENNALKTRFCIIRLFFHTVHYPKIVLPLSSLFEQSIFIINFPTVYKIKSSLVKGRKTQFIYCIKSIQKLMHWLFYYISFCFTSSLSNANPTATKRTALNTDWVMFPNIPCTGAMKFAVIIDS